MAKDEENVAQMPNEWEDDFDSKDLAIPYKREDVEEDKKEEPTETEEVDDTDEEVTEAPELEEVVTLEDPGNYEPKDYSFDYNVDGKTYKIASSDDVDKIPNEDLEKLSAKDLSSLIRKANLIDTKHDKDEEEFNRKKDEYSAQVQQQEERDKVIETFAAEFDYLVSKGYLPEVPEELRKSDWTDPKIAAKDGVKEQKAILDYMVKENKQRAKLNLKPIDSIIDAFNAYSLENNRKDEQERHKRSGEARKQAGARISAPTNNQPASMVPKGIAVGRVNAFRNSADWS